jgi:hypothetical protein
LDRAGGAPVRGPRRGGGRRVLLLTALLAWAPLLAREAVAQRTAAVRARAFVITSVVGAGWRPDSAGAAARTPPLPPAGLVRIAGVGTVDVRSGPDEPVRVTSPRAAARDRATLIVEIAYVGA